MQHKFTPTTHLKRAVLTLLALILACAAAWAQTTQSVTYIDENGQTQTVNATQFPSNYRLYSDTWYYVSGTVGSYSDILYLLTENGTHNLILCDGATLTVFQVSQDSDKYAKLKVYGQSGGTGKLNVGTGNVVNAIHHCDFALYGGEVTLTYLSAWGHGTDKNVDFNGGKLTATSGVNGIGGNTTINATSGWIKASKYGGSVTIAEGKYMKDETGRCYKGTLTDAEKAAVAGKTLQPATQTEYISYIFGGGNGSQNSPYLIGSTESWNYFCDALQDNNTWNHFSGKYVKLGANISITQSAGSAGHEFMGTFDGDGKTLTVDITETTTQGTAPFREIKGATIQNLVVTGSVVGTTHAAGLVGFARGDNANTVNTITNCKVATNVTVTTPNSAGNYHCGGVVGHAFHCTLNMSNTVYCGNITNSGNNYVGGLQGWSDGNTINFSHCLFAGSYSGTASFHPVAVRNRDNATTANVSHVYYTVTPTLTNSSFIAADGTKATGRTTAPDNLGSQEATYSFMDMTVYENGLFYNGLYYVAPTLSTDNNGAYLISSVDDWTNFCDMLYNNDTWNRFSGQTVKLTASIGTAESPVTRMAGYATHDFCGTFNGQGNTITVSLSSSGENTALFSYISNTKANPNDANDSPAAILNLKVAGTVTVNENASHKYAGGLVGTCWGVFDIENCHVSTVINSSVVGDGTHGGIVGRSASSALTITGCVFDGQMLGSTTNACGGIVGFRNGGTVNIYNTLFAPTALTMSETNSATFVRNGDSSTTITDCYYTDTLGTAQGTKVYSISKGEYVTTLEINGTATPSYDVSGLSFYSTGIKCGDVLYAAASDVVSLTLGCTAPSGYYCTGYTATAGTLNETTLTMPYGNVTINATLEQVPPVNYVDMNGDTQQCTDYIWLTGTETTLGAAGQETWCVVHSTLDYSQGIQLLGNTHIILCDGAAMNIGTSDSPVSGSSFQEQVGFYGGDITYNLSLYAQSGNTGALTIYSQSCSFYVKDLTIAGGNVNATSPSSVPVIGCDNLTVCRSSLEVHAYGQAVQAFNDVTLSNVTANINSSNGVGLYCSNFTVDHSQLTVTAPYTAIQASNVITLGCTAATDFIKATCTSSLTNSYYGTVKIADGQTLYAGANAYTGTLTDAQRQAIGGQKLTNVAPPTYDYIDLDGTGATHTAVVIDADNMPTSLLGWYIVQGTVNYTNTINLAGDTHIILADNAVMNVTVGGNHGIRSTSGNNYSLFVYGQTGQSGELNVTSNSYACCIYGGDITIAGGKVTASGTTGIYAQHNNNGGNVTIKNATVTATASFAAIHSTNGDITIDNSNVTATSTGSYGIYAENGNITIDNSNVTATATNANGRAFQSEGNGNITFRNGGKTRAEGGFLGIYCEGNVIIEGGQVEVYGGTKGIVTNNIILGWTNPTDYIYSQSYIDMQSEPINIADNTTFIDEAGQTYSGTIAMVSGAYAIDGKTLYPNCVVMKQVAGYGEGNGGWVFIASPVAESIAPSEVHNLFPSAGETSNEYDLYRFNQSSSNGKEWQNWKQDEGHNNVAPGFSLVNGQGYLYASKETRTLVFAGEYTAATEPVEVPLDYDATAQLKGWNLVGNPFATQATMTDGNGQPVSFYVINGQNVVPYEGSAATIEPCTGVMVKAEGTGEKVRFTSVSPDQAPQPNKGSLQIALSQVTSSLRGTKQSSTLDNAIISFNEGSKLGKFYFGTQNANIYIPQGNEEYAIAFSEGQGEMPLNFKAEENGTYTISVDVDNVELAYLHLIDNLTGADVDLLVPELVEGPASYTFTAKTTDYESRFKLVFAVGSSTGSDTFAFFSNDNIIVNGEGTLQVIDMTGRIVLSIGGHTRCVPTTGMTAGVYVLRLINGEKVRTQKIVIE